MPRVSLYCLISSLFLFFGISVASISGGAKFEYDDFSLLLRANLTDGHQIPSGSFISNATPVINDRADVAIMSNSISGGEAGIWFRPNRGEGKIVYSAKEGRALSQVDLNNHGDLAFSQHDIGLIDGVFIYRGSSQRLETRVSPGDFPRTDAMSFIRLSDSDNLFFRRLNWSNFREVISVDSSGSVFEWLIEGEGPSYLFTHQVSGDYLAIKVKLGERNDYSASLPDQIWLLNIVTGDKRVIAVDRDTDSSSSFLDFDNSVGLARNGDIVFIAHKMHPTGERYRAIYHWDNDSNSLIMIGAEGRDFKQIEYFAPVVNDSGTVALRALNFEGNRTIFAASIQTLNDQGAGWVELLSEGSLVQSDRETARILYREGFPGFSGGLSLNNHNDLVFNALIEDKIGEKFLGQAIYKVNLSRLKK